MNSEADRKALRAYPHPQPLSQRERGAGLPASLQRGAGAGLPREPDSLRLSSGEPEPDSSPSGGGQA